MTATHCLKHLASTLCSRSSARPFPFAYSRFCAFSSTAHQALREQRRPTSSFITNVASSSSSSSSSSFYSSSSSSSDVADSFASKYLSVRIRCPKDVVDELQEALLSFGASSTSVGEEDDNYSSNEIYIDTIFTEGEDVTRCVSNAVDSVGLKEIPHYEVSIGEQHDWLNKIQESFHPVEVTEGLWIVPEWTSPPDLKATNIILNPGLAFGTGDHPTTKLCLLLLHGLVKGGERFLDYGTGSGILAIAALKFGASLSVGVDIDPQAITSALQNAALNNIEPEKMQVNLVPTKISPSPMDGKEGVIAEEWKSSRMGIISETEKYDVVIANILLNPLLDLADNIVSYAKPGGVIGLSGILSEQVPRIIERYSPYLEGISTSQMDGWTCVSGAKKRNLMTLS